MITFDMKDLNRYVIEPASKIRKDVCKRWNESAKVFAKWSNAHLPQNVQSLAQRCFNAAPVALVTTLLSPSLVAIGLAGGYLANKGYGPFQPEVTDAFVLGAGLGTGITCILRITAFAATYNPLHLIYGAIYAVASRILLQHAKILA